MGTGNKDQVWTREQLIAADKILNGSRYLGALLDSIGYGIDTHMDLRTINEENWKSCLWFLQRERELASNLLEIAMREHQDIVAAVKVLTGQD
jgi:hypothetical protein